MAAGRAESVEEVGSMAGACSGNPPGHPSSQCVKTKNNDRQGAHRKMPQRPSFLALAPSCRDQAQSTENYFERMPPEIVQKILSYLDAGSLFCIGHVGKKFMELANNNVLWYRMYTREFEGKRFKPKHVDTVTEAMNFASIQEKPAGYWKTLYFRKISGYDENKWKKQLKDINPYTGLPRLTEQVLRSLDIKWEITITDKQGRESTFQQSHAYFSRSSVTVCWSSGSLPLLCHVSSLQLHGVRRAPLGCTGVNKPGWRSLIAEFSGESIQNSSRIIGSDNAVKLLHLDPGCVIGIWQDQETMAFIMVNLHFHKLVERSLLGTSFCPYALPEEKAIFDDVDPEYGLHGYTLHILLHNTVENIMSGHFSQLSCKKAKIHKGFIKLTAISRENLHQHSPLSSKFHLPWQSEFLNGSIENTFLMNVTLLDDAQTPLWCVSAPVTMTLFRPEWVLYDYDGDHYCAQHQDAEGKVKMNFVWLKEHKQFFLIHLAVYLTTAKVNNHFRTSY
ncbi:F-box only protein 15 [Arapaima gigas]